VSIWTAGACDTNCQNCTCSASGTGDKCHALYRGQVANTSYNSGNPTATFYFSKLPGGTIDAGRQYWIAVVDANHEPTCNQLFAYTVRASGTFPSSSAQQTVSNVSIWGSASAYSSAPAGDKKCFVLITDGAGQVGQKVWFQYRKMCFTKTCS